MNCPFCDITDTKVIDTRLMPDGDQIKRRRVCRDCNTRFTTIETTFLAMPRVVKRDGSRLAFDEQRLRLSMLKALEKRPVSTDQVDAAIKEIIGILQARGDKEVSSLFIGELVMKALLALDEVAYIRFASVYHSFQNLEEFKQAIYQLHHVLSQKKEAKTNNV